MMNIYIQSKSGDFNTIYKMNPGAVGPNALLLILSHIRGLGGYPTVYRTKEVFVPFEEIEFIREATEDD
jgi:hypothetical protein